MLVKSFSLFSKIKGLSKIQYIHVMISIGTKFKTKAKLKMKLTECKREEI